MTLELQRLQREAMRGLDAAVRRQLTQVWRLASSTDAEAMTRALLALVPDVIATHGDIAATLAAGYYDEARAAAGAAGRFAATPAKPAPLEQIEAAVRWGVDPLWSRTPDTVAARTRIEGSATRLTRQPYHDTIKDSVRRDPARARYARTLGYSEHGPCGFCSMLAGRGAVYAASTVGFDSHDHCTCSSIVVFRPSDLPAENTWLGNEWQTVTAGAVDSVEARARWDAHVAALNELNQP